MSKKKKSGPKSKTMEEIPLDNGLKQDSNIYIGGGGRGLPPGCKEVHKCHAWDVPVTEAGNIKVEK